MASGSRAVWGLRVLARYQASPPRTSVSLTRSTTESKKAPRGDEVPEALATAPSSTSGTAEAASRHQPTKSHPSATAKAQAADRTRPRTVSWSALIPAFLRPVPTGRRLRSTPARHRLSNITAPSAGPALLGEPITKNQSALSGYQGG